MQEEDFLPIMPSRQPSFGIFNFRHAAKMSYTFNPDFIRHRHRSEEPYYNSFGHNSVTVNIFLCRQNPVTAFSSVIMCSYNSVTVNNQMYSAYLKINSSKTITCYQFAESAVTNKLSFEKSFKSVVYTTAGVVKKTAFCFKLCYNSIMAKW